MVSVTLKGLRQQLRRFDEGVDGLCAKGKHWSVARGGYDLTFQVAYDNMPVVDCLCGYDLYNVSLSDTDFERVCGVILDEYDNDPMRPMQILRGGDI